MLDTFGRPLKSLRVSLIDKCNLRCRYCMPEEEYAWLPHDDILTVEQIGDLVDVFSELGVDKVRLTGGEPLLRSAGLDRVTVSLDTLRRERFKQLMRGYNDDELTDIIASTTEPFCRACDRSRLTGDGMWFLCLYAAHGIDLRKPLRQRASQDEIRSLIVRGWTDRTDSGAEDRQALSSRGPLYQIKDLRKDPHREMHTLGG